MTSTETSTVSSKLPQTLLQTLKTLYHQPSDPGSLGGAERFYQSARRAGHQVSRKQIQDFLRTQDTYSLHRPARRTYPRSATIVKGIDAQWQADLADMAQLSRANKGIRFLLTVVDCFSKFGWAIPVKRKDAPNMVGAFKQLFAEAHPRVPKRIQTDKGKEFFNREVKAYLQSKGVELFATESDKKAAMVERFNRTLKHKIWAYFTAYNTNQYLDVLPKLLESYNNSVHRTIGMRPAEVGPKDEEAIWHRMYGPIMSRGPARKKKALETEETVRISKNKTIFEKGYLPNWTGEIFKVDKGVARPSERVYRIKDYSGENIAGTFYPQELQVVRKSPDDLYIIDKVLKTRKLKDGKKQYLVRWRNWPDKFNSWVDEDEMTVI